MWRILKPAFLLLPYWKPCPAFMLLVRLRSFRTIHTPFPTPSPILNFTTPSNLLSSAIFWNHLFATPSLSIQFDCPLNLHASSLTSKPGFSTDSVNHQQQHPRWPSNHRCADETCSVIAQFVFQLVRQITLVRLVVFALVNQRYCNFLQADMQRLERRSHCTTHVLGPMAKYCAPNASIEESASTVALSTTVATFSATNKISNSVLVAHNRKQPISSASHVTPKQFITTTPRRTLRRTSQHHSIVSDQMLS